MTPSLCAVLYILGCFSCSFIRVADSTDDIFGDRFRDQSKYDGQGNIPPLPIVRALMDSNTQMPFLRAMIVRHMMQQGDDQSTIRAMYLFKSVASMVGKQIIEEAHKRVIDSRTYTFQTTLTCNCALEYSDTDKKIKGFQFDLISAVCEQAGKMCEVVYDTSDQCYSSAGERPSAGKGLLEKHYDACTGWIKTKQREQSVAFTKPYYQEDLTSHLYVRKGNPDGFDPNDITGRTIAFHDGWIIDDLCLQRGRVHGVEELGPFHTVYKIGLESLFDALERDEADAVFMQEGYADPFLEDKYERIGDGVVCGDGGGLAMITRKDSDLVEWFDNALTHLQDSGRYYGICNEAKHKHGNMGDVTCMPP